MASSTLPPFSDLPIQKDGPPFNAWGLFGPDDELGRLNLVTPEAVAKGGATIEHGVCVSLNLPMITNLGLPGRTCEHHMSIDDIFTFNTQASSQWDGLRHFGYQHWPSKGERRPITSRAHLLDIPRYLSRTNQPARSYYDDPEGCSPTTVEMLEGCRQFQGTIIEPGDILLVRTGWTEATLAYLESQKDKAAARERVMRPDCGMERSEAMMRWHWEKGIAAVASDVRAYEQYPWNPEHLALHEVFLGGWGMPIGELFDLRELAQRCDELNKHTFFFSSMVLNVHAGIASPPNAQAIL